MSSCFFWSIALRCCSIINKRSLNCALCAGANFWAEARSDSRFCMVCCASHLEVLFVENSMWASKARRDALDSLSAVGQVLQNHARWPCCCDQFGLSSDRVTCTFPFSTRKVILKHFIGQASPVIWKCLKDLCDQWVWRGWNYKWCPHIILVDG